MMRIDTYWLPYFRHAFDKNPDRTGIKIVGFVFAGCVNEFHYYS